MTGLRDTGLPADHPRSVYVDHLRADETVTWFSEQAPVDALVDYVLGLLQVGRGDLRADPRGFARTADGALRLTAVQGGRGCALTVHGADVTGATRINDAIARESHAMMAALGRGEPGGNPVQARWAPVVRGEVREDFVGSPVLQVLDGADVVPLGGAPAASPAAPPPPPPYAGGAGAAPSAGPVRLSKGGNVSLTKQVPALAQIRVGLGWDVAATTGHDVDLDASAIMCGSGGRVLSDQHFVFFNNLTSPDGTVHHTGDNLTGEGDGDDEVIEVDLARMAPQVERIVVAVSIYDADARRQSFDQVANAFIRLVDRADGREIARYDLSEDATGETAMIFGEVYRRDGEWKFRAVGQGYASGLHGIAKDFGVNV
ncbi:TerD family protein [Nocardioides litoris]|uniref:TerD family protein n=1 Tax=Nocardioides litoris TaxID=1926648 RepID=UPI0024826005|nr:TerD family protein [Nocardioides litoris]